MARCLDGSRWAMVWAVDSVTVTASNNKRNAGMRDYSITAILSNNPFLVTLRTIVAEIPCNHWRSAETAARCGSTWEGLKRLTGPPRGLSAAMTSANQWGRLTLWVSIEFSLLCIAILVGILDTNGTNGSCHPRHVLAWLGDTVSAGSCDHLVATRLVTLSGSNCQFETNIKNGINRHRRHQVTLQLHQG